MVVSVAVVVLVVLVVLVLNDVSVAGAVGVYFVFDCVGVVALGQDGVLIILPFSLVGSEKVGDPVFASLGFQPVILLKREGPPPCLVSSGSKPHLSLEI